VTKTLVIKDYTNEFLEFKTISICIIYKNLLITLVSVMSTLNESLYYAYTPLFLCIVGRCSHCMCFNHHHHHIASDKLMVCHVVVQLPLWSTHHHHLPSLVLLLVCRVTNVLIISLLCCLCHGEVLAPPITLCRWWNSFAIKNITTKKKIPLFHFFQFFHFFIFLFYLLFFPKRVYFWVVYFLKKLMNFFLIQH
jgi:hypothetical protein